MTPKETDRRRNGTAEKVAAYLDQGKTVLEISRLLKISPQAVYRAIDRYNLTLPTRVSS